MTPDPLEQRKNTKPNTLVRCLRIAACQNCYKKTNEILTSCTLERPDFGGNVNISKVLQDFFELRFPLEIRLANPSEARRITACQEY